MKMPSKRHLLLEQLEERIFLDANPLAAVADTPSDPMDIDPEIQPEVTLQPAEPKDQPLVVAEQGEPAVDLIDQEGDTVEEGKDPELPQVDVLSPDGNTPDDGEGEDTAEAVTEDQNVAEKTETTEVAPLTDEQDLAEAAAEDTVTPDADITLIDPMIGEDFTFTVTFDNPNASGGATMYGPYIDLILDSGLDAGIGSGAETNDDGISFVKATYLGSPVQFDKQTVGSTGEITHKYATGIDGKPMVITGLTEGDQYVSLLMPFGSFTPDQTAAEVVVTAHMSENADVNVPLDVEVINGALYGDTDALNNPGADPPLRGAADGLTELTGANAKHFLPEVIAFNTDINLPTVSSDCQTDHGGATNDVRTYETNHQEIPTGPNFPGVYTSTIDIADAQTVGGDETTPGSGIDGIVYTQTIPTDVIFNGIVSVKDSSGADLSYTTITLPGTNPDGTLKPGGNLKLQISDPVTGTKNANDIVIKYNFYVPQNNSAGTPVIDPSNGDDEHIVNDGEVTYTWSPIDSAHDSPVTATIDAEVDADGNFSNTPDTDDVSHAQSIAIQKNHAFATDTGTVGAGTIGSYNPGDILDFTLDFQISDFFSFGDALADGNADFEIVDTVANGLVEKDGSGELVFTANPVITIQEEGSTIGTLTLDAGNRGPLSLWWTTDGTGGNVDVHYDLQAILLAMGDDGYLDGGHTAGTSGATLGKITYQATIQQEYVAPGPGPGEINVDQGDVLSGGATITGDIFLRDTLTPSVHTPTGSSEGDQSCDNISIITGGVDKGIYAINGTPGTFTTPRIQPGYTVSYRLTYDLPISSTEDFNIVDYLPLPIFDVDDPDQDGTDSGWTQIKNATNELSSLESDKISAALVAGNWFFGPSHTYLGTTLPTTIVDSDNNALSLNWPNYHDAVDSPGTIDIVFTIAASKDPFADGLQLTNQVTTTEEGTTSNISTDNDIIQIILDQPELKITKGAVESSDPGPNGTPGTFVNNGNVHTLFTEPGTTGSRLEGTTLFSSQSLAQAAYDIDTNLTGIDGGDKVTFAIVVENIGHYDAYDVIITDTLPTGFITPTTAELNLSVATGNGTLLNAGSDYTILSGGFFSGGLELTDSALDGSIEGLSTDLAKDDNTGNNVIVITYDLVADNTVQPLQQLTNTATLAKYTNYDGAEADDNHVPEGITDDAVVTISEPTIGKVLVKTDITAPGNAELDQATIGELVTYKITLTVPEGRMGQTDSIANGTILRDTLDNGLAFVGVTSVSTNGLSLSGPPGTGLPTVSTTPANTVISSSGQLITFNLGQVTNSNSSNSSPETIVIEYQAVVLNTPLNQESEQRNNTLDVDWNNGSSVQDIDDVSANDITIVEPTLSTTKTVANLTDGSGFSSTVTGDTGDTIQYKIVITNANATSDTTAFDISVNDLIPAAISSVSISSVSSTGTISFNGSSARNAANTDFQINGNTLTVSDGAVNPAVNIDMEKNSTITIIVEGALTAATGDSSLNTANVKWSSVDGSGNPDNWAYNAAGVERTGADGLLGSSGTLNDYQVESSATIESPSLVYKTIVSTSEAATSQTSAIQADTAIGEIVRYRLYASIGEGDTDRLQIQDNLPTGTRFLNDGTARWTFIASTAGNMVSTATPQISALGNSPTVVGNGTALAGLSSAAVSGTFNDDNISNDFDNAGTGETSLYTSGQDVFFRFGDITNNDRDTDLEFVVVEFNVLVENIAANQAGTTLDNTFALLADTQQANDGVPGYLSVVIDANNNGVRDAGEATNSATDNDNNAGTGANEQAWANNASLTLVEPQVAIDKSVVTSDGSTITYQVVLTNTGTNATTAYDTQLRDSLNATNFSSLIVNSITPAGGASAITNTSMGNALAIDIGTLPVGGTVTIVYEATLSSSAAPSGTTTIDNTADITWTSLPGTNGTTPNITASVTPGGSGTTTGERTGAGGINDYSASDTEQLGSLGNRVFYDLNGDGVQDAGEQGIAGVPITVRWEGADGIFGNSDDSIITTQTDTNGLWTVAGVPIGIGMDYRVSAPAIIGGMGLTDAGDNGGTPTPDPDSLGIGISAITLSGASAATTNNVTQDFGYRGTASLGNRIYIDADGDGVQDTNGLEPSLSGIDVNLTWAGLDNALGTADDITFTTTSTITTNPTDPNYIFEHLPAGNFSVTVAASSGSGGVPANMDLTDSKDDGVLNPAASVTTSLTTGQNLVTMDFGYQSSPSIGDRVWYDADGDEFQDAGEPGIAGVTVNLLWSGPDGAFGGGDDVTFTTTTNANGYYLFSGLPVNGIADPYRVTVTPSATYPTQTFDNDGTGTANQSELNLMPKENNRDQDFGYRGTAELGNQVWEDLNANGIQDMGETGIDGVGVELFYAGADGIFQASELATPLLTTSTSGGGTYQFDNLAVGTYKVRFSDTGGTTTYSRTQQDAPAATDANDSDAGSDGFTGNYTLALNESNLTVDAGLFKPISLGDRIYFDYDGDGVQDSNEPGISNVTVQATWYGPDGVAGGGDDQTFTTTTGTDGKWNIDTLPPGTYEVTTTPASGYTLTDSMDDGALNATSKVIVSATNGAKLTDIDFGFRGTGSIGDQLWIDQNGNGIQDPGESGIPGVTLTIGIDLDGDGTPDFTTTTTTDASGSYIFEHLPPGSHVISVDPTTLPDGINPSFDPDGILDNTFQVSLGAGQNIDTVDFGYNYPPVRPTVVPPTDPTSPPPIVPPLVPPQPATLEADAFFMYRQFGDTTTEFPWDEEHNIPYVLPPLPVSPVYTGMAEPGTTLYLILFDSQGNQMGFQTVMADTAGNWLASFPATVLYDLPHHMELGQTASSYNNSSPGLFNARTYFNPNGIGLIFSRSTLDVDMIFAHMPSTIMASMHASNQTPFNLNWNDFNGYEFFSPSINPAKIGH